MKIDEGCIEHNAVKLIHDLIETRYDLIKTRYDLIMGDNPADERGYMLMTLGEIGGIVEMVEALKEVLKV